MFEFAADAIAAAGTTAILRAVTPTLASITASISTARVRAEVACLFRIRTAIAERYAGAIAIAVLARVSAATQCRTTAVFNTVTSIFVRATDPVAANAAVRRTIVMILFAVARSVAAVRPAIVLAGAIFGIVEATSIAALGTAIIGAVTRCLARFARPISATFALAILWAATGMLTRFAGRIAAAEHTSPTSGHRPAGAAVLGAGIKVFAAVATSVAAGGPAIVLARATFVIGATVVAALIVAILVAGT